MYVSRLILISLFYMFCQVRFLAETSDISERLSRSRTHFTCLQRKIYRTRAEKALRIGTGLWHYPSSSIVRISWKCCKLAYVLRDARLSNRCLEGRRCRPDIWTGVHFVAYYVKLYLKTDYKLFNIICYYNFIFALYSSCLFTLFTSFFPRIYFVSF